MESLDRNHQEQINKVQKILNDVLLLVINLYSKRVVDIVCDF